jgi:hypothetical protein
MEKFSTRFIAFFVGITPPVLGIIFSCLCVTFFTTNLISKTLKANVASNLGGLFENPILAALILTCFFAVGFSLVFEGIAFWLVLQNEKLKSYCFAIASGLLASFGMLQTLPIGFAIDTFQSACTLLVYFTIGFAPPCVIIVISEVLYKKLSVKTDNGMTILGTLQKEFEKSILGYFKEDTQPQPKQNRFDVLLGGLAPDENEIKQTDFDKRLETYKQKYNANN